MKKAISYIRYSSDKQAKGDSYRRQIQAAEEYCKEHGLVLENTLLDSGISAFKGANAKMGALASLIQDVQQGRISKDVTLIIESLDRLSRMEVQKALRLLLELLELGLTVVTLSDNQVYHNDSLEMTQLIISLVIMSRAHEESAMKSQRLSAMWERKRQEAKDTGKVIIQTLPAWLYWEGDKIKVDKEKAKRVKEAFKLMSQGVGRAAAVRQLNERGILAPSGIPWSTTTIQRMLNTQTVIGHYEPYKTVNGKREPTGEVIKDNFPAIIKEDIYWSVRHRNKGKGASQGAKYGKMSNLFTGLATCKKCGSKMRYIGKKQGHDYLACRSRTEGTGCDLPYMHYPHVERIVLTWLQQNDKKLVTSNDSPVLLESLREKLLENEQKQAKLIDVVSTLGLTNAIQRKLIALEDEAIQIKKTIEEKANADYSVDDLEFLIKGIESEEIRHDLARQLKRLDIKIEVGEETLSIVDGTTFNQRLEKGVWYWVGDDGFKMSFKVEGYERMIKGLNRSNSKRKKEAKKNKS